jgi:hypothetical protein
MLATRIYAEPVEVEDRLALFGVTREDFFPIVQQVVAARADTIALDSKMNAGMKAFLAGLRHTRLLFVSKGYVPDDTKNIESSVHPETGVKVIYQNVDLACSVARGPKAISAKGSASDRMIENAQGLLFDLEDIPELYQSSDIDAENSVWFFCVSVDGDDVAAEFSRPARMKNRNFDRFIERILIVQPGEWAVREVDQSPTADDYEFSMSRKEL